jgi:hypothetical protein
MLDFGFNLILFLGISVSLYFIYKELEVLRKKLYSVEMKLLKNNDTELSVTNELRKGNVIEIFSNNSDNKDNSVPTISLNFEKYITEEQKEDIKEVSKYSENLNNVLQNININNLVKKNKPELINIAEQLKISINNDKGKPKTKAQLLVEIKNNLN